MGEKKIHVSITTYNRPQWCLELLTQIKEQSKSFKGEISVSVFKDRCKSDYKKVKDFCVDNKYVYKGSRKHHGKWDFWELNNKIYEYIQDIDFDYFIQLPDDVLLVEGFFEKSIAGIVTDIDCNNLLRSHIRKVRHRRKFTVNGIVFFKGKIDCAFITTKKVMTGFSIKQPLNSVIRNARKGSGVGKEQTNAYNARFPDGQIKWHFYSLLYHRGIGVSTEMHNGEYIKKKKRALTPKMFKSVLKKEDENYIDKIIKQKHPDNIKDANFQNDINHVVSSPNNVSRVVVTVNTHKRPYECLRTLKQIHDSHNVAVFHDLCDSDYSEVIKYCQDRGWNFFRTKQHFGKWNFWLLHNIMYEWLDTQKFDYYVQLPDDFVLVEDFFNRAIDLVEKTDKVVNICTTEDRSHLENIEVIKGVKFIRIDWVDCAFISPSKHIKSLRLEQPKNSINKDEKWGSGVGHSQSRVFLGNSIRSYYSLVWSDRETTQQTTMHTNKKSDYETLFKFQLTKKDRDYIEGLLQKVDVYIPSLWRNKHILKTLASLLQNPEVKTITVVCNNYTQEQLSIVRNSCKDNRVKFIYGDNSRGSHERVKHIHKETGEFIGFADDDLIYPNDYYKRLIAGVDKYGGVVAFQGKVMKKTKAENFYRHIDKNYKCLRKVAHDVTVDNVSCCVLLFRRDSFSYEELKGMYGRWEHGNMDDLYISWEFSRKGLPLTVLAHEGDYFTHKEKEDGDDYIFTRHKDNCKPQTDFLNSNLKSIAICIPIWKRYNITKYILDNYRNLMTEFNIIPIIVGSEGELSKNLAEGLEYVEAPNNPLSDKWNKAFIRAKELDVDACVIAGSDTILTKYLFEEHFEALKQNVDYFGILDAYYLFQDCLKYWEGYNNERLGEPVGSGRMFSKKLLNKLNWQPYRTGLNKSLDGDITKKIKAISGIKTKIIKQKGLMLCSLRSETQITKRIPTNCENLIDFTIVKQLVYDK